MHGSGACMVGACMAGGMHGGNMHGGGHVWWGACMAWGMCGGGTCIVGGVWVVCMPPPTLRDMVNERVVRILLDCILVQRYFSPERSKYFRNVADGAKGCYTSEIRPYFSVWGGRCSLCLSNMHSSTFPGITY